MVTLSPVVKLTDKATFNVLRAVPIELATVRLQDLVSKKSFMFNKTYRDIISSGGLHNFLDFHGRILLSLIMKDEIIANFNPTKYASAINLLCPDLYTTVDGQTYEGEYSLSLKEIKRIHNENKELIDLCPKSKPVGLVKGCSENQIEFHVQLFKSLGIEDYIFHVGDFFRNGDPNMIMKARNLSHAIRKHAKTLILYGMGSQTRLQEFSFADVFISFKHFVTAKNGMRFARTKKTKYVGSYNSEIVTHNFVQMYRNLRSLEGQSKLF